MDAIKYIHHLLLFTQQVNTGNYRKAVELFRGLLSLRPGLVGAHLGLGSALALLGGMENAVASFTAAIEVIRMFENRVQPSEVVAFSHTMATTALRFKASIC